MYKNTIYGSYICSTAHPFTPPYQSCLDKKLLNTSIIWHSVVKYPVSLNLLWVTTSQFSEKICDRCNEDVWFPQIFWDELFFINSQKWGIRVNIYEIDFWCVKLCNLPNYDILCYYVLSDRHQTMKHAISVVCVKINRTEFYSVFFKTIKTFQFPSHLCQKYSQFGQRNSPK